MIFEYLIIKNNETEANTMKQCILISGLTIALDVELVSQLQKIATVLTNLENKKVEAIIAHTQVDLVLLEIEEHNLSEVESIKNVKTLYPDIEIVLVDGEGDRNMMAKAFKYGARDAFRKPYKIGLLLSRIKALLKR